jgi:hypothetical protein
MSIAQTFWVVFGILLLIACVVISAVTFGRIWFVDRPRLQKELRATLGGKHNLAAPFSGLWGVLQSVLVVAMGGFCVIGIGVLSLFWVPVVFAWYRLRGKPLPPPQL